MKESEEMDHTGPLPQDDDASVTMPLPQVDASDTETRKIARVENLATRTGRLLQATSSQLLRYITGKKRLPDEDADPADQDSSTGARFQWESRTGGLPDVNLFYRKHDVIGEGGQGIVYEAEDLMLNRHLAIKSLRKEWLDNEEARRSFVTEARVTAALEHPAIIPVHLLGTDGENGLHLAMKFQKGQSFQHYLEKIVRCYRRSGTRGFDEAASLQMRLDIIIRCCEALSFAHAKGIVHCDLKPENILLGEYNETYIMDWGIARRAGAELPPDGHILGTPRYTSPENLAKLPCDGRSDLYSMGVVLFEAVTLSPAFRGRTPQEIVQKVANGEMEPIRHRFHLPISRDLAKIIAKATALVPSERYADVMELAEDLRRFQRGDEVKANPDNWFGKILRWGAKHNRGIFLLSSAVLIIGVVFFFFTAFRHIARGMMIDKTRSELEMEIFSRHRKSALEFDAFFSRVEKNLNLFNTAMATAMAGRPLPGSAVPSSLLVEISALPPGRIDFNRIAYRLPPRSRGKAGRLTLSRMAQMAPLNNQVIGRSSERLMPGDTEGEALYRSGEHPIHSIYVGFSDGTMVDYPARGKNFSADYDPRKRPWFRQALKHGYRVVWGSPYSDARESGRLLVTCSQEIWRHSAALVGVTSIDVSLDFLKKQLESDSRPELISRGFLTADGTVIFETDGCRDAIPPTALRKIRSIGEGFFYEQENGRLVLWVFSRLHATGWLFFERIDFPRVLNQRSGF